MQNSQLYKLLKNSNTHRLIKGQTIQFGGDRMFLNLVNSGYVKRYLITEDGEESIQVMYGPDDVFPLTPVFSAALQLEIYRGDEILYYEALTDAEVYSVEKNKFLTELQLNESIYKDLFYVSGTRLESNIQRLENGSLKSADKKIVDLLLYYMARFGTKTDEGVVLDIPLTHKTIANSLAMARETVSHTIGKLYESNILMSKPKHIIVIKDSEKLRAARGN